MRWVIASAPLVWGWFTHLFPPLIKLSSIGEFLHFCCSLSSPAGEEGLCGALSADQGQHITISYRNIVDGAAKTLAEIKVETSTAVSLSTNSVMLF